MLSFSTVQDTVAFPQGNFYSNPEGNFLDDYSEGFVDVEIVIDSFNFMVDEPVKKLKINDTTSRTRNVETTQSNFIQLTSISSILGSPKNSQNASVNLNKNLPFKIIRLGASLNETECFIQDILGKRRNPVFSDEDSSFVKNIAEVNEKVKMNIEMDKLSTVNEDSETTAEEESVDHNTDVFIPIGPAYQAELPALMNRVNGESCMRRSPKMKWNPEVISSVALNNCIEKMYQTVNQNITNHEKAVKLLMDNDMNVDKLLCEMRKNKLFYRGVFSLNQRVRRNKTLAKDH